MGRRSGLTLVEVLVAIFVMGIGLIALLALFPIGILRMAQAIRDDRCAAAAQNAHAGSVLHDIRMDPAVVSSTAIDDPIAPIPDLFRNPFPIQANGNPGLPNADPFAESYPIFVDPLAIYSGQSAAQTHWVGGLAPNFGGYLRRRDASFIRGANAAATNTNVQRFFTLWDDINYESTTANPLSTAGTPKVIVATVPPNPPPIERNTRYSWAYIFRRPQTSDPTIVDCSIVIFEARPLLALNEQVYTSYFDPVKNTITIPYTAAPPQVRPGAWILDNTLRLRGVAPNQTGSAHANFYRVVAVDDVVVAGNRFARYEVQSSLKGFQGMPLVNDPSDANVPPRQVIQGTTIVMEGVAEVIERGPVRMP